MAGAGGSVRTTTPRRRSPMPASSSPRSIIRRHHQRLVAAGHSLGFGIAPRGYRTPARFHVERLEGQGGDRSRQVAFFGFSLGGATGFVLMGTRPDFARIAGLCKETTGGCAELHNGVNRPTR